MPTRDWRKLPWHVRYRVLTRWASDARRLSILATHRHCTVRFDGPVRLGPGFQLDIPERGTFIVGPGVDFRRRFVCEIAGDGRVEIGAGTVFTAEALLQCTTSITVGVRAALGQSTLIADGNHRFRDPDVHFLDQGYEYRPITIGSGVAIMTKSTVLADVGDHTIVAANSVVTRPIPAYCLAAGAPARVIDYFGPPELRPEGLELDR